jgi:hypothetical protein
MSRDEIKCEQLRPRIRRRFPSNRKTNGRKVVCFSCSTHHQCKLKVKARWLFFFLIKSIVVLTSQTTRLSNGALILTAAPKRGPWDSQLRQMSGKHAKGRILGGEKSRAARGNSGKITLTVRHEKQMGDRKPNDGSA